MKRITKQNIYIRNWIVHHSQPSRNTVSFWANFADVFTYPTDIEPEERPLENVFFSPYSEDAHHIRSYFNKAMGDIGLEEEDNAIHAIR